MEKHSVLVVSTAHVTYNESKTFSKDSGTWNCEYGFMIWVPSDKKTIIGKPSDGLSAILNYAQSQGCAYVMFDRDGDVIEGLPVYNW